MIIVDSNVWIFAEVKDAPEHLPAVAKLERFLSEGIGINAIIFSEIFYFLSRLFSPAVARKRVETILHHPSVEWLELKKDCAEHAMELAERKTLRINDAMIAQQALMSGLPILTDNVKDFKKVNGLKVTALR